MTKTIGASLRRLPFLLPAILAVVTGMWGGLIRVSFNLPLPVSHAQWITHHGALMVCGFLGTVIAIERAVGRTAWWAWLAPLFTGFGAISCIVGLGSNVVLLLFLTGSVWFAIVTIDTSCRHHEFFTCLMAIAALAWVTGNALLFFGKAVSGVIWWWATFLGWTILAERLELSRLIRLPSYARPLLVATLVLQLAGLLMLFDNIVVGERLIAAAFVLQAVWLIRFDLARKNILLTGLPRFSAACLLIGYGWLALTGCLLAWSTPLQFGVSYDAVLHAYFLGFVFAMIFGHAPIIFPAVLNIPITFKPRFYLHLVLLTVSLAARVLADFLGWPEVRAWSAAGNAAAILTFAISTSAAVIVSRMSARQSNKTLMQIKNRTARRADEENRQDHDLGQRFAG
ncbi:hypothetical protein GC207_07550 [bacterium]|nr:hypothetical protein [bacterium]